MTAVLRGASLPLPLQPPEVPVDQSALARVAQLLKIAKKPIFYVGQVGMDSRSVMKGAGRRDGGEQEGEAVVLR
jgi:thiamine pyrophosphate-dependent acetolactate synthase large subunit-like protein